MTNVSSPARTVVAGLTTFGRPEWLERSLNAVAHAGVVDDLVVVDNAPSTESELVVAQFAANAQVRTVYLPQPANLGPAGGIAVAMKWACSLSPPPTWFLVLDDDDPVPASTLDRLVAFADLMTEQHHLGAVGLVGGRLDVRQGLMVRPSDAELSGAVPVDAIGGNHLPLVSLHAIRAVGPYRGELFFGFEELEFGLRLRGAGYEVLADGEAWLRRRADEGRLALPAVRPERSTSQPAWREYYSTRNLIVLLREHGASRGALLCSLRALGKAGEAAAHRDRRRAGSLVRGLVDGWRGRLGRTVEPSPP